jgi:hypothetical protein
VVVTAINWGPVDPANPAAGNVGTITVRGTKPVKPAVRPQPGNPPPAGTLGFTFHHPHPVGFSITQAVLGNPGPQTNFDYRTSPYTAIVPYAERIR